MAHQVEPVDLDCINSDFDNKENTFNHNNALPCTEKGYEELDVSELNMKLRYSLTPTASPMSKSFTNCTDNRTTFDSDDALNYTHNDSNLTRSLNSTMTKNDNVINSLKTLPLQSLCTDKKIDKSISVMRQSESAIMSECNNMTVAINGPSDFDDNISLCSTNSSLLHTPEATTPTKEITKTDGGSPILRGLKSVLNMFRSSQSPITPTDGNFMVDKPETNTPVEVVSTKCTDNFDFKPHSMASTPIATPKLKENNGSRRSSPYKDSIVFNDDLEKELQWKDETTIIFSHEKIPVHKLFFQQTKAIPKNIDNQISQNVEHKITENLNTAGNIMDISYNESVMRDKTITVIQEDIIKNESSVCNDSDSEFLDCETTFIKNDTNTMDNIEKELKNENDEKNEDNFIASVENNQNLSHNQNHLDGNLELIATTIPPKPVQSVECDKPPYIMIDSLEAGIGNDKLSQIEFKTDNILKPVETMLQLNNTRNINERDIKDNIGNNICSEYELDSLEHNFMPKTSDIHATHKIDDVIIGTINKSSLQDMKGGDEEDLVNSRNVLLPIEIPLPDENDNEVVPNMIETKSILSDHSLLQNVEINTAVQDSLDETTAFKVISNVTYDDIVHKNLPLTKTETDDELLIKNEINDANIADSQGKISAIKSQSIENINLAVENNNANVVQTLIEYKSQVCSELLDNFDTSSLCDDNITLNYLVEQHKSLDSFYENFSKLQVHAEDEQYNVQLPNDSHVVIENMSNTADTKFYENVENVIDKENISKTYDNSLHQILIDSQSDLVISHHITENKTDLTSTNANVENLIQDTVTVLETKETLPNIEDEQVLSNLFVEHKDSINKEENGGKHESYVENIEGSLKECQPFKLNYSEDMIINKDDSDGQQIIATEPLGVNKIFNSNREEIQNMAINEPLEINLIVRDVEISDTLTDNTTLQKSIDTQENVVNSLEDVTNNHNVEQEHVFGATSNKQELDTTIKIVGECTEPTHNKELAVNESVTLDINLSTNHMEIPESSESNTTLKKDMAEYYNVSQTPDEVLNEKYINNVLEEKTISVNLDTQHIKSDIIIDKNLGISTNYIDTDGPINELDTFMLDEEIVLSENNSPYVSVAEDLDKVSMDKNSENVLQSQDANTTITISNSPPITSKGYNFNFDEIEDPFATKISSSPSSETKINNVELTINNINVDHTQTPTRILPNERRKIQTERKKTIASKKKLNESLPSCSPVPGISNTEQVNYDYLTENNTSNEKPMKSISNSNINVDLINNNDKISFESRDLDNTDVADGSISNASTMIEKCSNILNPSEVNKSLIESTNTMVSADHKKSLSSDQSSYYSVGVSSCESVRSKNVFNLPEIDDINFNPFAVKSKLCQSPLPNLDEDSIFVTKSKLAISPETSMTSHESVDPQDIDSMYKITDKDSEDKMETEPMEKSASVNRSSDNCSSNVSEKNITVKENNTEDEDTIEGPFLEDLNNDEITCFDGENVDMMKFNDIPNQESEDNVEGELFIDAEAFQFLLNQNKSNVVSDSGKESLFLKFDPLFAKRISSDSIITALSKIQNRQSTPIKAAKPKNIISAIASTSKLNITCDKDNTNTAEANTDNHNITVSKPMMVVPPAVNAIASPRKSQTPTRTNRYSGTFTSPAMAVIDRLLSLSANNSLVEHEPTLTQASREQNEANLALTQLRELLAEKEIHVYNLRSESKDLKDRLIVLESHMSTLETESQQRLKKIDELTETLSKKTNMDRNMAVVFEEYESTIANLIAQIEKDKKQHAEERTVLIKERNEQTAHLRNMEVSFNDLHSKYEKIKQVISNYKANEESYKKTLMMFEENFTKAQNNYELLKQHATSKLNYANEELQKINKAHEAEVLKMNAMIKRKDLHITSLEETLAQKTKANEELTAICDELINKVG